MVSDPFFVLRQRTTVKLRVSIKAAQGLQSGSTSSLYAMLKISGKVIGRTQSVRKTRDPVWEEDLTLSASPDELLEGEAIVDVYEENNFSKDHLLGQSTFSLKAPMEAVARTDEPLSLRLPFEGDKISRGTIFIKLSIDDVVVPTWRQLLAKIFYPPWLMRITEDLPSLARSLWSDFVVPITKITEWPKRAKEVRRDNTEMVIEVAVIRATDLIAADFHFGRSNSSDPYVNVTLGEISYKTSMKRNTLSPVWNESFEFRLKRRQVEATPLSLEVFDDDRLTADDSLGTAELPLMPLFESPRGSEQKVQWADSMKADSTRTLADDVQLKSREREVTLRWV